MSKAILIGGGVLLGAAALLLMGKGGGAPVAPDGAEDDPDYVAPSDAEEVDVALVPPEAAQYADIIKQVADEQGIDSLLISAIGWRESNWGTSKLLDQQGPGGCGDYMVRSRAWVAKNKPGPTIEVGGLYDRWKAPKGWTPPYCVPADSRGWGRGLMQIDYGASISIDWTDPYQNITQGAKIWRAKRRYITNNVSGLSEDAYDRAATAAYNTGEGNVVVSLRKNLSPDATTSGGDYSAWVFDHMDAWRAA
jgi:hypothetical protein